jgi:hypothetical protein
MNITMINLEPLAYFFPSKNKWLVHVVILLLVADVIEQRKTKNYVVVWVTDLAVRLVQRAPYGTPLGVVKLRKPVRLYTIPRIRNAEALVVANPKKAANVVKPVKCAVVPNGKRLLR